MLRIQLICVGKLKESFYIDACDEYDKRLRRYCALERVELPETGDLERDGAAVLAKIPAGAFVSALCVEGQLGSSEPGELRDRRVRRAVGRGEKSRGSAAVHVPHDLPPPSGAGDGPGTDLSRLQHPGRRKVP